MRGAGGPGGSIDVMEWLRARQPAPPAQLAAALSSAVGDLTCASPASLPDVLLARAESLLASLDDSRESAESLLAADALITYALEAAAEDCASVDSVARVAMKAMGSLAESSRTPE